MRLESPVPFHLTSVFTSRLILFFVFVFFCISLLTGQVEMTVLTLFLLGTSTFSWVWSCFAFKSIGVTLFPEQTRVFAGDTVLIHMTIANQKWLPVWINTKDLFDPDVFDCADVSPKSSFFLSYQKTKFSWRLKTLKRGSFKIGNAQMTASDPLGFYPRQKTFRHTETILIFPRIVPVKPVLLSEKHFFGSPGAKSPVQDPVYIIGTRDCGQATPVKMIHWKASARIGRLQEKVCEPSVQGKILIVTDIQGFLENDAAADLEKMLETAASLACEFLTQDQAVGFLTNAVISDSGENIILPGRSRKTAARILETTARITYATTTDIQKLFRSHTEGLWGVHCVFCCYSQTNFTLALNRMLTIRKIPATLIVCRRDEKANGPGLAVPVEYMESICP